jgi:hypothetical protein
MCAGREVIVTILVLIYAFWVMLLTYHSLEIEKLHGGALVPSVLLGQRISKAWLLGLQHIPECMK